MLLNAAAETALSFKKSQYSTIRVLDFYFTNYKNDLIINEKTLGPIWLMTNNMGQWSLWKTEMKQTKEDAFSWLKCTSFYSREKMVDGKSKTRSRYLGVESGQKCTGHEIRRLGRQKEASVKNLTFLTRSHSQLDKIFFVFCKSSSVKKIQLVIHLVTVILQFKSIFFSFTQLAIH